MLTGKQKHFLRSKGQTMRSIFQVGHNNLSIPLVNQIQWAIAKRELIKINILQTAEVTPEEVAAYITARDNGIEVAQIIGHTLLLYKPAKDIKNRRLSLEVQSL